MSGIIEKVRLSSRRRAPAANVIAPTELRRRSRIRFLRKRRREDVIRKIYPAAVLAALICAPALANDLTPKIAAHLIPPNAEIHISWTSPASDPQGRSIEVACGEVSVRNPRGFDTMTFAYVIGDDKLWLAREIGWMKEPEAQGIRSVMRYCPGR
ncbi:MULTISPECIES: hypothetical protein [Bradyrhizobium]|uniref:hypothetical protein n=1 Tax=Bradyrhizobium TaxID=374 RepID=UPI001260B66C|nr:MULTISPECIES: hypothetical protein [unclassified Bradyrhizobium]